jgi:hypothetical protein
MPTATGLRRKLNPALLVGSPYREGEVMANRYLVKDAVGVGPMGFVLRTADRELGIDVSVKLIHPRFVQTGEERDAFAQALEPAKRFLHPSLTRLHEVGNDQGWPYFTYTFLDGLPLRRIIDSRLAKGQTFAMDEVEPILGQLMAALEAAHPAGAHGDLKAENILVLPDMLKVTDWGVAAGMPRPPFVQAERQKGVHRHLAPEYLAGLALEPRADVYSLGVLVGEMLTGLTPEDEIPELRLVNPELPDAVEGFYRRALSERPESRFRSVREMFEAFASVLEGKSSVSAPSADSGDDGFEVVDFNETQMVVVQPDPVPEPAPEAAPAPAPAEAAAVEPEPAPAVAPEPAPEPTRPQPPADFSGAMAQEVAAEVAAQVDAAVDGALPKDEPPASFAANAEPDTASEEEFWAETGEAANPAVVAASEGPLAGTLWSDEEDEEDEAIAPRPAEPLAPSLSLAEAPQAEASPSAAQPPTADSVTGPEAPPLRAVPTPHVIQRIGGAAPAPRPVVPAVGIWGPGALRTGAHAAVAVALPEVPSPVESVASAPVAPPEVPAEIPPAVRAMPAAPTVTVAPRAPERSAAVVPVLPVPAIAPESTVARPKPVPASPEGAHQGGLWSPGAALAELVSEMRTEDARRLSSNDGDTAPAAKAAQVVSEQRASRERLALMSASEEPTAPTPSVSGRPRKTAATPVVSPPLAPTRDQWLRWGLVLAVFFAVGMVGAALLLRAF